MLRMTFQISLLYTPNPYRLTPNQLSNFPTVQLILKECALRAV